MNYGKIEDTTIVIDTTTEKDDPYHYWETDPYDKFTEELKNVGYTQDEIYYIDINCEGGIIVDYDLYPHEILRWDKKEKNMKLKMKYPSLKKYRKVLRELGIKYDKAYWEEEQQTKNIEY